VQTYRNLLCGTTGSASDSNHCTIAGGVRLTIPILGGRKALLRTGEATISEHGRWRHIHIGALRAAYGRSPFYHYYGPEIEKIILDENIHDLRALNESLHRYIYSKIGPLTAPAAKLRRENPKMYRELHSEKSNGTDPSLSIIDTLFRLGPDTIFVLLTPLE